MNHLFSFLLVGASSAFFPVVADAHIGHVAEVAGHGHIIAIGAAIAAATLIGLIAKAASHDTVESEEEDADAAPDKTPDTV